MTNKPMLSVKKFIHEVTYEGGEMVEVDKLPELCGSELYVLDSDYQSLHEQMELLRALLDKPDECRCKRYGKDNPHWPCPVHAKPAVQHQGEPVVYTQFLTDVMTAAGLVSHGKQDRKFAERLADECARLQVEQPAPVAVVLPERELYMKYLVGVIPHNASEVNAYKDGWNTCLEEVARLNGVKP